MGIVSKEATGLPDLDDWLPVQPTGDPHSEIWCIGDAPGREEHLEQLACDMGERCSGRCKGHVFCGPVGRTFDIWLERAGIPRETLYVTNTARFWPGQQDPDAPKAGSKKPDSWMIQENYYRLRNDIEKYNPKYILGLGAFAYNSLLAGTQYIGLKNERIIGRAFEVNGRVIFPIVHPSAGLHNPFDSVQTWLGLCNAATIIRANGELPQPIKKKYRVLRGYGEVKRVLKAIPLAKRKLGVGVDTEGYPGNRWSIQFEVAPGVAYLIYASDKEGLRAFNKYAPRPFIFHNALADLDPIEELGIRCDEGEYEDTMVQTYVAAREPVKGSQDSDESSVTGQGLKTLSYKYLYEKMTEFTDIVKPHQNRIVRDYLWNVWVDMLPPERPEVLNKYHLKGAREDDHVSIMRPSSALTLDIRGGANQAFWVFTHKSNCRIATLAKCTSECPGRMIVIPTEPLSGSADFTTTTEHSSPAGTISLFVELGSIITIDAATKSGLIGGSASRKVRWPAARTNSGPGLLIDLRKSVLPGHGSALTDNSAVSELPVVAGDASPAVQWAITALDAATLSVSWSRARGHGRNYKQTRLFLAVPFCWGNPFKIIPAIRANKKQGVKAEKGRSRLQAIRAYKKWIQTQPKLLARLPELIGKKLVCCCAPQPCHGDVLAELVSKLPGRFHIPRPNNKGQAIDKRVFKLMEHEDVAKKFHIALEPPKPGKAKPDYVAQIVRQYGPVSELRLKDIKPRKPFVDYACEDADNTGRLNAKLNKELSEKNLWEPYFIDMGCVPIIRSMKKNGLRLDRDRLREYERDVLVVRDQTKSVLIDLASQFGMKKFNPDSNDDVAVLLYERMKAKHDGKKTPSGSRLSVEEKVLAGLSLKGKAAEFRKVLLDYKEYQTLLTRYIWPMPGFVHADGLIHPHWRHTITVSGRLACGERSRPGQIGSPNFMAFPSRSKIGKRIRNCFVAPEGYAYLSVDLSQIELRVLASLSRDPVMMRSFLEGRDMHDDAAVSAFGIKKPGAGATEDELAYWDLKRTQAKELNFGAAYGLSAHGYQARLAMKGVELDIDACEAALAAKHLEWEIAFEYLAAAGDELAADPDAISRDMWGRIRYLPMIWSPVKRAQAEARRQAGNMKIQGGAQGVEKLGMIAWWLQRFDMPFCSALLQIHDDMVFQIRLDRVVEYAARIEKIFSDAAQDHFVVPITAGVKYGPSWGEILDPKKGGADWIAGAMKKAA